MKRFALTFAVLGLMVMPNFASAAVIKTFTNQALWAAAAGGTVITEDFADTTLVPGLTITFGTNLPGSISGGEYHDRTVGGAGDPKYGFSPSIIAFGGLWDLAGPGGQGSGLLLTLTFDDNTTQQVTPPLTISNAFNGGFFGFVSDTPFKLISVSQGNQGGIETFDADNFQFVAQVPEPTSMALFGIMAVGGMAYGWRRRNQAAAV